MADPKCPSCKESFESFAEVRLTTRGAGDMVALCCPSCNVAISTVKAIPGSRAVEDAGRQVFDAINKFADKMQPK